MHFPELNKIGQGRQSQSTLKARTVKSTQGLSLSTQEDSDKGVLKTGGNQVNPIADTDNYFTYTQPWLH